MPTIRPRPSAGRLPAAALAAILLATSLAPAPARAQDADRDFRWDGPIAAGRRLYVRNLNGSVRIERATGPRLEITAEKRWRRADPADATVEVTRVGSGDGDVLVCVIWRDITRECNEDGYRTESDRRGRRDWNDRGELSVDVTVRVPEGVRLDVSSVNGGLDINGATADVEAHTVNGGIEATSSGGPVNASTVNGDIDVRMGTVGTADLDFSTTNGSITVTVPDGLNADVSMRTVNGSVGADFPMTVNGRINPRRITATIGRGGQRIDLATVNGSIDLRKR